MKNVIYIIMLTIFRFKNALANTVNVDNIKSYNFDDSDFKQNTQVSTRQ